MYVRGPMLLGTDERRGETQCQHGDTPDLLWCLLKTLRDSERSGFSPSFFLPAVLLPLRLPCLTFVRHILESQNCLNWNGPLKAI